MLRWESEDRYYTASVTFDLFKQLVIVRTWGGKRNRIAATLTELVPEGALRARLRQIGKERKSRGYCRVEPFKAIHY